MLKFPLHLPLHLQSPSAFPKVPFLVLFSYSVTLMAFRRFFQFPHWHIQATSRSGAPAACYLRQRIMHSSGDLLTETSISTMKNELTCLSALLHVSLLSLVVNSSQRLPKRMSPGSGSPTTFPYLFTTEKPIKLTLLSQKCYDDLSI